MVDGPLTLGLPRLSDRQWAAIAPMTGDERPPSRGRPFAERRAVLDAILHVLVSGAPWSSLPQTFGCSACTARRTYKRWVEAGRWEKIWSAYLRLVLSEEAGSTALLAWITAMARGDITVVKVGTGVSLPANTPWWVQRS